jgi:hypothetical protein
VTRLWAGANDAIWRRMLDWFCFPANVRRPTPNAQRPMPKLKPAELSSALAVADTERWWLAVHQILDTIEWETIEEARRYTADPERCAGAVCAGEAIALVRQRLKQTRDEGLRGLRAAQIGL